MALVAPRTFDNGAFIAQLLGSFWYRWFPERSTLIDLINARGEPFYQVYLNLLELVASKSRFAIPVFHSQYWHLFTVKESQKSNSIQLAAEYNVDGLTYQNADKPAYGDKANDRYFTYALPGTVIKKIHAIYNRVIDPSLIWLENKDYQVDGDQGVVHFYTDPFVDPLVPKRDILDANGNVVDREIALWFNLSSWDQQFIYEQFGYALNVWMKSSTFYREFISAIWDNLVLGPTVNTLKLAFSALTGIPFAKEVETVARIIDESPTYKHVETNKNIYTFKASVIIIVEPGQVLQPGEAMTTSVVIIEPSIEEAIPQALIPLMSIQDTLMNSTGVGGPITLENAMKDVTYLGLDPNGKAIVRFDVQGFPQDVEAFWERSHREGLRLNRTLADVLDTRTVKTGPTLPTDLPAQINPMDFVTKHIFIDNLFLVYVRPVDFAPDSPGLGGLDLLYKYMQPHTTYMIFVEIPPVTDYYRLSTTNDSLSFFKGFESMDIAPSLAKDKGPVLRTIPGRCR